MTQEIKIPVSANTDGAERNVEDLAGAFDSVSAAVSGVGKATQTTTRQMADMLRQARELRRVLSDEFGKPFSVADTIQFERQFQANKRISPATRRFDSGLDYMRGYRHLNDNQSRARTNMRRTTAPLLQGTDYAHHSGDREPSDDEGGGGGGGSGGGGYSRGVRRAGGAAMGFGKSMLALAGINSLMGMAGRALDNANEESIGVDTLKRRMGDLGVDFDTLRDRARAAGAGLGITSVETQRLGQAYAKIVGNLSARDVNGMGSTLRSGIGMARAYGLDPNEGNQFFGMLAKTGVARNESEQRRFALLIGDAVAKSGYSGKVDELLGAVADYSQAQASAMLTAPNADGYTNAITSLLSKGYAGMGPSEAAAVIGTADSSVRHGGAMGVASQNFIYASMRNANPDISVADALALQEGGLFGSSQSVFGDNAQHNNPLFGRGPKKLDNVTTFEKLIKNLKLHYKTPEMMALASQGVFGKALTQAQVTALDQMQVSGQLGASIQTLQGLGIDPNSVNPTSLPLVAAISNAKGLGGVRGVAGDMLKRTDLTADQRKAISGAMGGGDEGEMRRSLVAVAATLNQEKTDGQATRQSLVDLNQLLADAGHNLMPSINLIRDAVIAIAKHFGYAPPISTDGMQTEQRYGPHQSSDQLKALRARAPNPNVAQAEREGMAYYLSRGMTKAQAAAFMGDEFAESTHNPKAFSMWHGQPGYGLYQLDAARQHALLDFAKENGLDPLAANTQRAFHLAEMDTTQTRARTLLSRAGNDVDAALAGDIASLKPAGYNGDNPTQVSGYAVRAAVAHRLFSQNMAPPDTAAPGAGGVTGTEHHVVDVNINGKPVASLKLPTSVGKPAPAGTKTKAISLDAPS